MKFADASKLQGLLIERNTLDMPCNECNCNCDEDGSCAGPCSPNCKCYEYESPQSDIQANYRAE